MTLSRGGTKMKTPHGDLDRWPDPASSNARRSVFAQDLVVEGDATSSGPIEVQGNVVGSLRAPEIIVAESGHVEGSVVAYDLVVLGAVSGTVSARNVQLAPSAVVQADVIHEQIAIEAGAELEGRLQRKV
jgi:cytoskeletal protein CcmA (bactofilin family)